MLLEVCCYGYNLALIASKHGADRIELCSARSEGGLTPSYGDLKLASQLDVPVYPILRPRGGDFCYTDYELDVMKEDLIMIREMGFRGVVFGMLTVDGDIDMEHMAALMELAGTMEVSCHRAFDMSRDPFASYDSLEQLGVTRILTSGMKITAKEGLPLLKELNTRGKPIIMAGGGVRADNMQLFIDAGLQELHTSASKVSASPMRYQNPAVSMSSTSQNEYERFDIDTDALKLMKRKIQL